MAPCFPQFSISLSQSTVICSAGWWSFKNCYWNIYLEPSFQNFLKDGGVDQCMKAFLPTDSMSLLALLLSPWMSMKWPMLKQQMISSIFDLQSQILKPHFSILHHKSSIFNPQTSILTLQSLILTLQSSLILNPKSSFQFSNLNPHSSIINPQSSILNPQSLILNPLSLILNPQSLVLNP